MKKQLVAVRLSEQQAQQLAELEKAGFGNQSDIIRTALDRMYQQEKKEMNYQEQYRSNLISDFMELNVGQFDELDDMTTNDLANMVDELYTAREAGNLNLETDDGIDSLKSIVDKYA